MTQTWEYPSATEIRDAEELHALAHDRAGVHVDDCTGPDCPIGTTAAPAPPARFGVDRERVYRGRRRGDDPIAEWVVEVWAPMRRGDAGWRPLRHTCDEYRRMTGHLPTRSGCHSPDGFSWGYGGSGPSELARMLLRDVLGRRVTAIVYQTFKENYVARWGCESSWRLDERTIRAWLTDAPWRDGYHPAPPRPSAGGPPVSEVELYGEPWERW